MDRFVCVRIVQAYGLDLQLFQFDNELTWAVFFMNADKTIYGRYGTRSDHKLASRDVSLDAFKKAVQAALELHKGYPGNKKELAGKTGGPVPWKTPEQIPELKPKARKADGSRGGCVHCHQAHDFEIWSLRAGGQPITDKMLWSYPMPSALGLKLDPKEMGTVADVETGSPAEKAGFKTGDAIARMDGQPIVSIADIQWVLHNAKEPGSVKVEVSRGGEKKELTLPLAAGWRRDEEFSWRSIVWRMRHALAGTGQLKPLSPDEKKQIGVATDAMALRIEAIPPNWVKERNASAQPLQKGDVIIEVDGKKTLLTESDYLAYLMGKKSGQKADLVYLRGGKKQSLALTIP
jgi:hypothetical protein